MTYRFSHCPCCGEERFRGKINPNYCAPLNSGDFFWGGWRYIKDIISCEKCGYGFINSLIPRYEQFYKEFGDSDEGYSSGSVDRARFYRSLQMQIKKKSSFDLNSFDTVLDVGAGDGEFLKSLNSTMLKSAIEPSPALNAMLGKSGVEVFFDVGEIPDSRKFQVISVNDVLEHVEDPSLFVNQLLSILEENGVMIISVPDYSRILARMLKHKYYLTTPMHLSYFTWKSMRSLLSNRTDIKLLSITKAPTVYARLSDALKWLKVDSDNLASRLMSKIPIGYRANFIAIIQKNCV